MEIFTIDNVIQIISGVGFPIFVAVWLLYYGKKQQEELRDVITELKLEVHLTRKFIEYFTSKEKLKEEK